MKLNEFTSRNGAQTELAKKLGVTVTQVNHWSHGVRPIPVARCVEIEKATKGIVRCEDLRPDIDWAYLRRSKKAA